jgi:2-amino-4-hydroxy-6-hydroxymethyldihydropteridine diphosphokinase
MAAFGRADLDVYIGLGTNLGHRRENLAAGLAGLAEHGLGRPVPSGVWETAALDGAGPYAFLNMVARVDSELDPRELLDRLLGIERAAGRTRTGRKGPRILDLDLLLVGDLQRDEPGLTLPHPRMWRRRFVLAPLAELAPDLINPASGRSVVEEERALREVQPDVRRVGPLAPLQAGHL